jgi:receptor-type tyrosine-protein phosphatase F
VSNFFHLCFYLVFLSVEKSITTLLFFLMSVMTHQPRIGPSKLSKITEPGSSPRNVQVRPLSSSTMVIQWDEPETANGQVTGYKVYYTTNSQLSMAQWESQVVDNNQLTTINELTPHTIYTIRVQAFTSVGPGPLSAPVHVKTQQGVPSQPSNLMASDIGETAVTLQWSKPTHSGENIVNYELYWNDTYAKEKHHRRIPISESYTLTGLYPNTLYYVWLAARSQRGEGATTPPIPVRTKQYGKRIRSGVGL